MGRKYRPRPYDGPVLLVPAGDDLSAYDPRWRAPDRGRGPLLRGDVTTGDVDAPHTAIAHEPYVQEVARILNDAFAAVEPSSHRPATMKP
jgi:thioesterase domain-containing protein